jgi:hypothetical protein
MAAGGNHALGNCVGAAGVSAAGMTSPLDLAIMAGSILHAMVNPIHRRSDT